MLYKVLKNAAPLLAAVLALGAAGCDGKISINGKDGTALADLDLSGNAPTELVLAGPDDVIVTRGDALAIEVDGDRQAVEALRFTLDDTALGIMRDNSSLRGNGKATVRVTMPPLAKLVIAGSGTVTAAAMAGNSEATIAGSGTARITQVDADALDVTIAGSDKLVARGRARALDLNIVGSGKADMSGLTVESADVTIAGSGDAAFASDGTVEANVLGSGDVTVTGSARCTIKSMGSGTLRCNAGTATQASARDASRDPAAPPAPDAPTAPPAPE